MSLNKISSNHVLATTAKGRANNKPNTPKNWAKNICTTKVTTGSNDTCLAITKGVNQ